MSRRRLGLAVVLVLATAPGASGGGAPLVPAPAAPHAPPAGLTAAPLRTHEPQPPQDDRGCDILSYDLELRLDPQERTVGGTVAVGYAAVVAGLDTLRLDLVEAMAVATVRRGDRDTGFRHAGATLAIALAPPPVPGVPDTVVVTWQGIPLPHGPFGAGLMFREHDAGTPADRSDDVPVVANVSQPWSAHSWWPCKDLPGDKALVSLAATVPDTLTVVGNGTLEGVTVAAPGWRRWAWREAYPIAPYLVSVAVTNYVSWAEDCRPPVGPPVSLEFAAFPQDTARAAHDLAPTCAMLGMLTEIAGPWPFPGERYAQAEIKWIGAMEHQTATSISRVALTGDGRNELLVIHELAHQWFGDALTPAAWRDIWLNEGFARYAEALWVERTRGPAAYRQFMLTIGPRGHPDLFAGEGLLGDPDPVLPNLLVYDKGAWLLHSLRLLVGDEAFFRFLADYADLGGGNHGSVTSADVAAAAARAGGRDLENYFNFWLQTDAVVEVEASWDIPSAALEQDQVAVTLAQRQDPLLPVAIPLTIATTAGSVRRIAVLELRRQSFAWTVPGRVTGVAVDPDSLALLRRTAVTPPPLLTQGPWPNPVPAAGGRFRLLQAATGPVSVRIYDLRGRLLDARSLGELAAGEERFWDWRPVRKGGAPLPSGVCWLVFEGPAGRRTVRALVLH